MPLADCLTRASLMEPEHPLTAISWTGHAPFAFWLVEALRPRTIVELGTHAGYSYFCFCQAVRAFDVGASCHAVDTWRGDEHASFYDEDVFGDVEAINARYGDFSRLHRMLFAEALPLFEDGSIDLLHIDGRHRYEDVREDYEGWLPKLAPNGVVLLHDTRVRRDDFGVHRFFAELRERHPAFEFHHQHGLGVVAPSGVPDPLRPLLEADVNGRALVADLYARLGDDLATRLSSAPAAPEEDARLRAIEERLGELDARAQEAAWGREASDLAERDARLFGALHDASAKLGAVAEHVERVAASAEHALAYAAQTIPMPVPRAPKRSKDWKGKRERAANRIGGSYRLLREYGPAEGGRLAVRNWSRMGRPAGEYADWVRRCDTMDEGAQRALALRVEALKERPLISVVMPVYDPPAAVLREAIASVRAQVYGNWELCIANDASREPHVRRILDEAARSDPRIRVEHRAENGNISAASNTALAMARGAWIALLDHDDVLPAKALATVAVALAEHPHADILYSDEDKIDELGHRFEPYFKPDFSVAQLLEQNLINHLGVYRTDLVREAGGFREGFEGSQDHDLALRCLARSDPSRVVHLREVLYHWRPGGGESVSEARLEQCVSAARRAIADYVGGHVRDRSAERVAAPSAADPPVVEANPVVPSWHRVRWPLPADPPLVSAIVPTRDAGDLVEQCVSGLLERTDYPALEVVLVDNGSTDPASLATFERLSADPRVRVLRRPGPFNYSALNNAAAREARGDLLLLINNDIDVIGADWLAEMVGQALRPEVGIVGAKLLYGNGTVQHAGVRLGAGRFKGGPGVAGHLGLHKPPDAPGHGGLYAITREVSAVTAACMLVRREAFEAAGGLDERELTVAFNDIDLCLKARAAGWRVVYAAHAVLHHLESATRGSDLEGEKLARFTREANVMRERWAPSLDDDPFYSPRFDHRSEDFTLDVDCPTIALVSTGRPVAMKPTRGMKNEEPTRSSIK